MEASGARGSLVEGGSNYVNISQKYYFFSLKFLIL